MKKMISAVMAGAMAVSMTAYGGAASSAPIASSASAASSAVSSAAASSEAAGSDMEYVKNKGKLVVGITDFEPMDYKSDSGEWIGFDADLAKAFAQSLGVEADFVEIDWDNKLLELNGKSIDCVWNGMTLTDEVTSSMECSNAYCNNAQVVVLPVDMAEKYQTVESLSDLNFAVESGSAGEAAAKELGLNFTPVSNQASALMEVAAGTSGAAIIDSLMAGAMVGEGTSYDKLTYTLPLSDEKYGVGFRKGSDLAAALNDFFAASKEDGSMQTLAETYGVQAALVND